MYLKQIVEAGGNFYEEYGYDPEILEEPTDIYLLGLVDGEVSAIPTLPESLEYWDGYCYGLRNYYLKQQGKKVVEEM
jgi:hypothetical protein